MPDPTLFPSAADMDQEQLAEVARAVFEGRTTLKELKGLTDAHLEAIYSVAYTHYQSDQFSDAIAVFSWLCLLDPFQSKYWMGLAAAQQMNKAYEQAIDAYGFASLTGDPNNPLNYLRIGECCLELGEREAALNAFSDAERLSAERPEAADIHERASALCTMLRTQPA
jgi:type III secretion system low calcium response chaperone LcrH/SycD